MKIRIAYTAGEHMAATLLCETVRSLFPGVRVHESAERPPYRHIFLTTKKVNSEK